MFIINILHVLSSSIIYPRETKLIIKNILKHYWGDTFWRNNAIFLTGSLLVAFVNYLYHPVLGRLMDVSHFGEVQVLLSILNLAGILLAAFQIVIINISANAKKAVSTKLIQQFEYLGLLLMLGGALTMILGAVILERFFKFSSPLPFVVLACILVITTLTSFRLAYMQGKSNFTAVSVSNVINALSKLFVSVALVLIGLKTLGAIGGILIAQLIALLYTARIASKMGFITSLKKGIKPPDFRLLKPELRYLLSVMAVFFIVTLLYTGDILVAKRYFSPEEAGQYAGISAIAKIIFFATGSFVGVLLASVGSSFSQQHNRIFRRKSLFLVMATGGAALILFSALPTQVINIMLGDRYIAYAHLLPLLSLVIYLVSIINLYFYYYLAMRRYSVVPVAVAGGATTLGLTLLRHDSLELVIQNFLIGSLVILFLLGSLGIISRTRQIGKTA